MKPRSDPRLLAFQGRSVVIDLDVFAVMWHERDGGATDDHGEEENDERGRQVEFNADDPENEEDDECDPHGGFQGAKALPAYSGLVAGEHLPG